MEQNINDICTKAESIVNIINSEEFKNCSMSFFLDSNIADIVTDMLLDQMDLFCEDTEEDVINILNSNEEVVVSVTRDNIYGDILFVEPVFHDGEQCLFEMDLFFIQSELVDILDMDFLVGDIAIFSFEEEEDQEEEIDKDELFVNDIMESLLYEVNSLNGNKCAYDVIKSYLLDVYEVGYADGIRDSIEKLTDNLKEQF